ncbi:MAG: hybrid sensor histidine kinase/response regulator [Polyangiaceae bacterium]|nr:hybrid sensor histidine kinase/response regulator [Polyangiaceae bacterium]
MAPEAAAGSFEATILVIDDNEANRALARNTLEDEGYRVVLATCGHDGVIAFEREHPHCVLLDVRMPDIDGFGVCERIRMLPHGRETPILFLTALRDVDTFDRALAVGGDDFLTKPVRPTELVVRVQTALKLRRMNVELRDHYELLKHQRDDLMRLQLQKERLMAFVVHDLKNPVNAMDLHAQLLLRDEGLSPNARSSVTRIRSEAQKLTRMILNLLDVSKADEGKLSAHPALFDLVPLVSEVLSEFLPTAAARNVEVVRAIDVTRIHADEDLFRRLLTNLVDNAIRHAPVGSKVSVVASPHADFTELRVIDRGEGVLPEMRDKIFDPFVRLEVGDGPASRSSRGLGLAFCKLAVLAHGGRIWVEDGAPGAIFCVRLPNGV